MLEIHISESIEPSMRQLNDHLFDKEYSVDADLTQLNAFFEVQAPHVLPLFSVLRETRAIIMNLENSTQQSVGSVLVRYACLLLHLYIPNVPHDPAIQPYVDAYLLKEKQSEIASRLNATREVDAIFVGHTKSLREVSLLDQLNALDSEIIPPSCYRPERSQSRALFQDMSRFLNGYVNEAKISALLSEYETDSNRSLKEASMLQKISSQVVERLKSQFVYYTDICDPIEDYVAILRLGLSLAFQSSRTESIKDLSPFMWLIDGSIFQSQFSDDLIERLQQIKNFNPPQNLLSDIYACLMQWLRIRQSYVGFQDSVVLRGLNQTLQMLHYNWSLNKSRMESEKIANTTVYKANDEEDEDFEFKSMFPDYENFVTVESYEPKSNEESIILEVYSTFLALFGESSRLPTFESTIRKAFSVISDLNNEGLLLKDIHMQNAVPAIILATTQVSAEISGEITSDFNFYRDGRATETEKSVSIFQDLRTRILQLVVRWPENEILRDCLRYCEEFLNLPTTASVARLLSYVEKQLDVLHEWQKVASSEYSVAYYIDALSKLIVEWRRLELTTWASLFDNEIQKTEDDIAHWFFYIYENIISVPLSPHATVSENMDEHLLELIQAVTMFIGSGPQGQFEKRLQLIRAFSRYALTFSKLSNVGEALCSLYKLYSQFIPVISGSIASQRKALEKEISEALLLASWKDTNHISLKESARRSHHKLYKSIRKFREVLHQPVRPLLDGGLDSADLVSVEPPAVTLPITSTFIESETMARHLFVCSSLTSWSSRPERLVEVTVTAKRMRLYALDCLISEVPSLSTYANDLIEEMARLRRETPSVLNEETKRTVQFLKTQKTKLFSETLKDLKAIGLKFSVRADVREKQDSVIKILRCLKGIDEVLPAGTEDLFFRLLEFTPRLRSCAVNHSDDLTPSQIQRGLGIAENLLSILIRQREHIGATAAQRLRFSTVVNEFLIFKHVAEATPLHSIDLRGEILPNLMKNLKLCCANLNMASSTVLAHARFSEDRDTKLISSLAQWSKSMDDLAQEIDRVPVPSKVSLINSDVNNVLGKYQICFTRCDADLTELLISHEQYAYILVKLRAFISRQSCLFESRKNESQAAHYSVEELEGSLRYLTDSILVVIQEIRRLMLDHISNNEDSWISVATSRLVRVLRKLHIEDITAAMEKALEIVAFIGTRSPDAVGALFSVTAVFVEEYSAFVDSILTKFALQHNEMVRGGLALFKAFKTVATNGYCSPQEPNDDDDHSNLQSGTGLGDGDGEQNISNTVGDDEDLTDLANQPDQKKEDNKPDEREEQENAVDMDGEMEGDLESVDQSGEDEDNEGGEQSDEELDEEVGSVDDLDPSAVDEKLWNDDAPEDSSNDKNSEQQLQDSSLMDDLTAKTDEKENPKDAKDDLENDTHDEGEEISDGEDEESGMEQNDEVAQHNDADKMDSNVQEGDALDLPEDMNLDDDDEADARNDIDDDPLLKDDSPDNQMDLDEIPNTDDTDLRNIEDDAQNELSDSENPEAMDIDGMLGTIDCFDERTNNNCQMSMNRKKNSEQSLKKNHMVVTMGRKVIIWRTMTQQLRTTER